VTIRAKKLKILETIVAAIAILVMKLHAEGLPMPFTDSASLASVFGTP
jgi:hypothetical protein